MENIYDVADFFLSKESMTHKKLQKLCYYAQAWYLANFGEPLVLNRFEAWVHGPVCPDLYIRYRDWGWEPLPKQKNPVLISSLVKSFLDRVFNTYGQYDGDQLESMTHMEFPWKNARGNCGAWEYSRNPIAWSIMRDYYGKRIGKIYEC